MPRCASPYPRQLSSGVTITLNGRQEQVEEPCTVEHLLGRFGLLRSPCAVEVNGELVPKAAHAGRMLGEGDTIEIVTLVGGG
jgi:sulfur carrier protein